MGPRSAGRARIFAAAILAMSAAASVAPSAGAATEPSWTPSEIVARVYSGNLNVRALADDRGDFFVAWSTCCADPHGLWVARFVMGAGWESPLQLSGETVDVRYIGFAVNAGGQAIVAWSEPASGALRANRYEPDVGWQEWPSIERGSGRTGPGAVAAALDESGTAYLAWTHREFLGMSGEVPNYQLSLRATTSRGTAWDVAARLNRGNLNPYAVPAVAASPGGGAIVAWTEWSPESPYHVLAARSLAVGGWDEPQSFEGPGLSGADQSYAAADGLGNFFVAWRGSDANNTNIVVVRRSASGWETPVIVGSGAHPRGYWGEPGFAVARSGQALAAWSEVGSPAGAVRFAVFEPGAGWSAPRAVGLEGFTGGLPKVVADGEGNFLLIWPQVTTAQANLTAELWSARRTKDGNLSAPQRVFAGEFTYGPVLASDRYGNALAVWAGYQEGFNGEIRASRLVSVELEGVRSPQSGIRPLASGDPLIWVIGGAAAMTIAVVVLVRRNQRVRRKNEASDLERQDRAPSKPD